MLHLFPGHRCLHAEQFTVICHIIVVTVDFQTTFEGVLVCDLVLMALLTLLFLSLSTKRVVFLCVTCPCNFWTKCHANLFVFVSACNEIAQVQIYYRPGTVDAAA